MYRIGYPFWRTLARAGVPLKLRIEVMRDEEAQVFVATSEDLPALIAEAASMDDLVKEIPLVIDDLMTIELNTSLVHQPVADLRICTA